MVSAFTKGKLDLKVGIEVWKLNEGLGVDRNVRDVGNIVMFRWSFKIFSTETLTALYTIFVLFGTSCIWALNRDTEHI